MKYIYTCIVDLSVTGSVGGAQNEDGRHAEWEVHQHPERHRQNDDRLREDEERPHEGTEIGIVQNTKTSFHFWLICI